MKELLSPMQRAEPRIERAALMLKFGEAEAVEGILDVASVLASANRAQRGRILALKVSLHHSEARYDEAARCAKEAIAIFRELGDTGAEVAVATKVARLFLNVGNTSEALAEAVAAMELAQQIGEREVQLPVLVECFLALAYVYLNLERYDKAIAFCERGAECARVLGDVISEGVLLDSSGCAYGAMAYEATAKGDSELAASLVERSIENSRLAMMLARSGGHRRYEATALANTAEGLVQSGKPLDALALMEHWPAASSTSEALLSHKLDTQGTICMALGRTAEAIELFGDALRTSSQSNLALAACEHLADAFERNDDLAAALAHQKQVHTLYKRAASEAAQRSASVAAVHLQTQETLVSLNEHRAIAADLQLSNEQLNRRADDLLRLSRYDPLTGLANRRLIDELLEGDPFGFGIVMVDVDHFKAINDGWSHIVGDAVLRTIATVIVHCCRGTDVGVRYGGDEFAILIKGNDERNAAVLAERVRAEVESFDWSSVAEHLSVSVSVGCSARADEGSESAFTVADRRPTSRSARAAIASPLMKQQGRNATTTAKRQGRPCVLRLGWLAISWITSSRRPSGRSGALPSIRRYTFDRDMLRCPAAHARGIPGAPSGLGKAPTRVSPLKISRGLRTTPSSRRRSPRVRLHSRTALA